MIFKLDIFVWLIVIAFMFSVYFGRYFWACRIFDKGNGYLIKSWIPFCSAFIRDSDVVFFERRGFLGAISIVFSHPRSIAVGAFTGLEPYWVIRLEDGRCVGAGRSSFCQHFPRWVGRFNDSAHQKRAEGTTQRL